jgi:TPP-dependent indolepyruvate ferredoxin oxidoreductase alpha subunit
VSGANLPSQKDAIATTLALYDKRPFAVADIGSQSAWLKGASHHPRNLYVSGPMGLASSVALGVAACRPNEQVLAICGDGALAMNLSSLVTIQGARRANLTVLVLANGIYEYTGSLPVPTRDLDWLALGRAVFGAESCFRLEDLTAEKWSGVKRPAMIVADIAASTEKTPALGMTPSQIREAFREASKA